MKQPLPTRIAKWVLVVLISVSILFPLAWMAIAGFKSKTEVLRSPFQFFPEIWRVENYIEILQDPTFSRAMLVTFGGALIFTVLSLFVNSMAAYAFARLEFRFKRFWWVYCVLPMFVPSMRSCSPRSSWSRSSGCSTRSRCSSSRASITDCP